MNLSPVLRQRFEDANGLPLSGGELFSYVAGTTTPQPTYSDSAGTTNTNPVVLDADGYADVWLDPSLTYKFVLQDSNGVLQWSVDNVSASAQGITTWNANTAYSQGEIVADGSGQGLLYVSLINTNQGNPLTDVSAWRVFQGNTRTVSVNTTLLVTDDFIRSNSTSGNLTHTLPPCSTTPVGKEIGVKDIGTGGNTTSVKGSGTDLVDGANVYGTALIAEASAKFRNNGSSWDALGVPADGSISTVNLADATVTTAKIPDGAITIPKLAAANYGVSSSCGLFSTGSTTPVDVTNLSVTITTNGRPVKIGLMSDGSTNSCEIDGSSDSAHPNLSSFTLYIYRDSTLISRQDIELAAQSIANAVVTMMPASSINHLDTGAAAGTHTYKIQLQNNGLSGTVAVRYAVLYAYEI